MNQLTWGAFLLLLMTSAVSGGLQATRARPSFWLGVAHGLALALAAALCDLQLEGLW